MKHVTLKVIFLIIKENINENTHKNCWCLKYKEGSHFATIVC